MKPSRRVGLFLVVLIICGSVWYAQFWFRRASAPQLFGEAVLRVDTSERALALTFDDGPNPPYTERLLDILDRYGVKATFFVVGQEVEAHPATFRQIVMRGHEIGNHSWNHSHLTYKCPAFVLQQIASTDAIIRSLGYTGTIYFRAPYGHKLFVLPYLLHRMHRPHILWNIEVEDWDSPPPTQMLRRLDEELVPGSIILLHDGDAAPINGEKAPRDATVDVTERILKKYQAAGYRFVTISELLRLRRGVQP